VTETPRRVEVRSGSGGPVVYLAGHPLTGPDAAASVRRRLPVAGEDSPEQTLYILASPLHAAPLKEWVAALPPASGVLIVELDPELAALPGTALHAVLPPPVRAASSLEAARSNAWGLIRSRALRRVRMISLSGGARLHRSDYARLEAEIAALVQRFWNNRAAEIRLHRRWMANLFRNISLAGVPVDRLRGALPQHALLVGAGPSLDDALPLLREFFPAKRRASFSNASGDTLGQRDFALIAIDTALPSLAAAGVRPDLVFAMDGQLANAADFLPWRWDDCLVVTDVSTHFSIPRRVAPGRLFWFVSRFSETALFRDESLHGLFDGIPMVPPRGSIAPAAVQIAAEHLGVADITCVGIDFWYRLPKSHAVMSSADRPARRRGDRLHHRSGHSRALARPWGAVTLRDGTTTTGDAVLVEQARLMAEAVRSSRATVFVVGSRGLEIGGVPRSLGELRRHLEEDRNRGRASRDAAAEAPLAVGQPAVAAERRRVALEHLRERLIAQEAVLADAARPLFLDSGLDFVIADLPQWPLMMLRREWVELHRARVLRAVRDYRRRLDASILG
jgi:hypothetical protein